MGVLYPSSLGVWFTGPLVYLVGVRFSMLELYWCPAYWPRWSVYVLDDSWFHVLALQVPDSLALLVGVRWVMFELW